MRVIFLLTWSGQTRVLSGQSEDIKRVHLFLNKACKWYVVLAILVSLIVTPAGYYFLKSHSESVALNWEYPWIFLVALTSVNLINLPLLAVIEGGGNVYSVNRLKFFAKYYWKFFELGITLGWLWLMVCLYTSSGKFYMFTIMDMEAFSKSTQEFT